MWPLPDGAISDHGMEGGVVGKRGVGGGEEELVVLEWWEGGRERGSGEWWRKKRERKIINNMYYICLVVLVYPQSLSLDCKVHQVSYFLASNLASNWTIWLSLVMTNKCALMWSLSNFLHFHLWFTNYSSLDVGVYYSSCWKFEPANCYLPALKPQCLLAKRSKLKPFYFSAFYLFV